MKKFILNEQPEEWVDVAPEVTEHQLNGCPIIKVRKLKLPVN